MPAPQTYANHVRWDPLFHFFIMPSLVVNAITMIVRAYGAPTGIHLWIVFISIVAVLATLKARLYALGVQDRVIRLEERLRLAHLLPPAQQARISELNDAQYVGLRFCSDAELPALFERALNEKLDRKQIKQAVKNWRPDYSRI